MNKETTLEKLKYPIKHCQKPEVISEADLKTWIEAIESLSSKINQYDFLNFYF